MVRIFVPQPIPEVAATRLRELGELTVFPHLDRHIGPAELLAAVDGQDILFAVGDARFSDEVLEAAGDVRLVAAMHPSAKSVDVAAATRRGIPVSGIPKVEVTETVAEMTLALLMTTAWRLPEADQLVRERRWTQNQSMAIVGTRLFGKKLGILGMGAIGQLVAQKVLGMGMEVLYHKRNRLDPAREEALGGARYTSLEELFRQSDVVTLIVPLTDETRGIVDADLLATMKPSAILINTSRGELVDEAALEAALRTGQIRGAGLDVYQTEPPDSGEGPSDGLLELPNVVLSPHLATGARETRESMALRTVHNIERFLAGERPPELLNPQVYDRS